MSNHSWIIGSSAVSQLVVDHAAVSGQHCRLMADGYRIVLEDLGSTNGTYVNGERLEGFREVKVSDRITLGLTQPMPWPDELQPTAKPSVKPSVKPIGQSGQTYALAGEKRAADVPKAVITIGRAPYNTVVLNEANVSTQHARLTVFSDRIVLEDLGSTNGTSAGNVQNKIHRAEVGLQDTIYFGSTACRVSDLIDTQKQTKPRQPASEPRPAAPEISTQTSASVPLWVAGGIAAAALLLVGIGFGLNSSNLKTETAENEAAPTPAALESETEAAVTAPVPLSQEERLARSLFVIVAADRERKTPFRVGTGFAIDSQHVATTASVISTLRNLQQNGFPEAFLYCPETGEELQIAGTTVHSGYLRAGEAARTAQSDYETIIAQYEVEPPSPEELESVKSQLLSAQEKAFLALDQKTTYDVAVIETRQSLPHWLTGAESGTSLRPNLKLNVRGLAFDLEDPFFDPRAPLETGVMTSRVRQVARISRDVPPRLLADGNPEQRELAYFGSPALNAQGQVVAIYSRPTPPVTEAESAEPPLTFDAPLFDRVRECLPHKP